jgi:hypothetical protein
VCSNYEEATHFEIGLDGIDGLTVWERLLGMACPNVIANVIANAWERKCAACPLEASQGCTGRKEDGTALLTKEAAEELVEGQGVQRFTNGGWGYVFEGARVLPLQTACQLPADYIVSAVTGPKR